MFKQVLYKPHIRYLNMLLNYCQSSPNIIGNVIVLVIMQTKLILESE